MTRVDPLIQGILEAHGAPQSATYSRPILYRDFKLYPNEGWTTQFDRWLYEHVDYDGDEDRRIGVGATVEECREDIDERFYWASTQPASHERYKTSDETGDDPGFSISLPDRELSRISGADKSPEFPNGTMVEKVARGMETVWLYGQRSGDDLWPALARKSLEASGHADLVEALRETLNIATSMSVAFNYNDPDSLTALGSARTVLAKYGDNQ